MTNIDYSKITEITVKTQEELDMIPFDFKGIIYIEFGTRCNPSIVKNKYNSSVVARGNSSVVARGNSSVVAWENSSVEARGNSSVVAWENSSVEARGNSQVLNMLKQLSSGKIKVSGNARIVYMPKNIYDFMDFYNIKYTKTTAIFYKAVRKTTDGRFVSDRNSNFEYVIGEIKEEVCDTNTAKTCSTGIHISYLNWALNYGSDWNNLAIIECETKIKDIVVPENTNGKVRTSKVKVLREVPLEECGIYGNIIAKRLRNKQ